MYNGDGVEGSGIEGEKEGEGGGRLGWRDE